MKIKKSNKFGCFYKLENNTLCYSPISTSGDIEMIEEDGKMVIDWAEVSDHAFKEEERKLFDQYIQKLFYFDRFISSPDYEICWKCEKLTVVNEEFNFCTNCLTHL